MSVSLLNGQETELPDILLKNEAIFKSVLNFQVWKSLSAAEKEHLSKFLPVQCQGNDKASLDAQEETVKLALGNEKGKWKFISLF